MNWNPQAIDACRICGNTDLRTILSLGQQSLTGIFPRRRDDPVSAGPLELVRCVVKDEDKQCGLVQLRHSFDVGEMYGDNYGYRSSLNRSMVDHLKGKVDQLTKLVKPKRDSLIIDIGSNDGTLLSFYEPNHFALVGIDPTSHKFREYYRPDIQVIEDFFSVQAIVDRIGTVKADIITSIAMFYDLEDPSDFVRQIADTLAPEGVWHFEQSYLPSMLRTTSYDTICHEHLEYYAIHQVVWLLKRNRMKLIDIELNDVNGGSFAITAALETSSYKPSRAVDHLLSAEAEMTLGSEEVYARFRDRVQRHRDELVSLVHRLKSDGANLLGYGASTKGNVILQYCGFGPSDIPAIAEVNADKFGCFTPGTRIPIISEADAKSREPDYLLVMPWHFRANLLQREAEYLKSGGKMIFPLPTIEIVAC